MMTPEFFAKFDENIMKINYYRNAQDDVEDATVRIEQARQQIRDARQELRIITKDEKMYAERIYRGEHPHFFQFFVRNRQQKIELLKKEQSVINEKHASLDAAIREATNRKQVYYARLEKATQQKQMLDAFLAKRNSMFDECVSSVPISPEMVQLQEKILHLQRTITEEHSLKQNLVRSIATMKKAEELFQQSTNAYNRAGAWNNRTVKDEQSTSSGHLDSLVNQARAPAMHAYEVAARGLRAFPQVLRERFPDVVAQIDMTPLPGLPKSKEGSPKSSGSSNGSMNDMLVGSTIRQNQLIAAQCVEILQGRIACCDTILASIDSSVERLQCAIKSLEQDRENERIATFERIRKSVCRSSKTMKMRRMPIVASGISV